MSSAEIPTNRELISASEIASLAGVSQPAVSNWKRRHAEFPPEIESGRFDRRDVVAWLSATGKQIAPEAGDSVIEMMWSVANDTRRLLPPAELPTLMLQLLVLRAAETGEFERLKDLSGEFEMLLASVRPLHESLEHASETVRGTDPDLSRALRPTSSVSEELGRELATVATFIQQLDTSAIALAQTTEMVIDSLVDRHGRESGSYSSSRSMVDLALRLLAPVAGTVYDPACGAARFLAASWNDNREQISELLGQEVNAATWRIGVLNLILHNAPFALHTGNTLLDDQVRPRKADIVFVDPPFGARIDPTAMELDDRWAWGIPTSSSAGLAWIQQAASTLAPGGRGAILVPEGDLEKQGRDAKVRQAMVDSGVLDAVIQLPPGLSGPTTRTELVLLDAGQPERDGRVLFVDARDLGTAHKGGAVELSPGDLQALDELFAVWRAGGRVEQVGFATTGTSEEIAQQEHVLVPNRYVSYTSTVTEIEGELIEDRYARLRGETLARASALGDIGAAVSSTVADLERTHD